jgi:hypothetical protein
MWAVNGYRADSGAVARFWQALSDARVGDVVATNPSNHRRMGVASDSTWRVELDVQGRIRSILVGRSGAAGGETYVRLPGDDTVYALARDLYIRVAHSTDDWRDRRILALDTAAVSRISVELDGQRYTIVRDGQRWAQAGGGQTHTTAVRIMLTELARLRAVGFLTKGDTIARKPYGGAVTALASTGDTLGTLILGVGPGDRWARSRGDSTLYRLAYYRVERVAPTREEVTGRKLNR